MNLKFILLVFLLVDLNPCSKIGKFLKKVGSKIKNKFEDITHSNEIKKDVKKIATFIKKLKDEDL